MVSNLPSYLSFTSNISDQLSKEIADLSPDKVVVLVDENTAAHCLPLLKNETLPIITIQSGEPHKTLETCHHIWEEFTQIGCSRNSLLINLGGGVIGDMGGFCASTFKRGMKFVNVPTTLLSQVDASIGGKLGIDFNGLKNHIGIFQQPNKVIIDSAFLKTLPERQLKSGFAEMLKHALIADHEHWQHLKNVSFPDTNWNEWIKKSVAIKHSIVEQDPHEKGLRKVLNFGHTLGHAIESQLLNTEKELLHGEAVAIGIILESHISFQKGMLSENELNEIADQIKSAYQLPKMDLSEEMLRPYLLQDKKNQHQQLSFSLIDGIGKCAFDISVSKEEIESSLAECLH